MIYHVFRTRSSTYTRGRTRMRVPTRLRTHAHACAHRRDRSAQRPAPHRIPAECVPPAVARRPGKKGGAYLVQRGDRRSVPRADVRVERRRRPERLRADPPAVDADGRRSHVSAWTAWAPNRTRAHAHNVAGRILGVRNRTHMHMDTMRPRARSPPKHHTRSHKCTSIYRYRTRPSLYIDTNRCTPHMARSTRAHALARTGARGHAHARVRTACHTGDPYEDDDL
jgi:hypothetical protein